MHQHSFPLFPAVGQTLMQRDITAMFFVGGGLAKVECNIANVPLMH